MAGHGYPGAVGQDAAGLIAEFLNVAEDVVPAAAVQAGRVLPQFPEDLVLRRDEYVVSEPRFELAR
jgi:hypothetical protein